MFWLNFDDGCVEGGFINMDIEKIANDVAKNVLDNVSKEITGNSVKVSPDLPDNVKGGLISAVLSILGHFLKKWLKIG